MRDVTLAKEKPMVASTLAWPAAAAAAGALIGMLEYRWLTAGHYLVPGDQRRLRRKPGRWVLPVAVAVVYAAAVYLLDGPRLAPALLVVTAAAPLAWIDIDVHRLPNKLLGPLAAAVMLTLLISAAATQDWGIAGRALAGGGVGLLGGLLLSGAGVGAGDAKLLAVLAAVGAAVSWSEAFQVLMLAFVVNGVGVAVLLGLRQITPGRNPMGPGLLCGALIALLVA